MAFGINVILSFTFMFIKEDKAQAFSAFLGWFMTLFYATWLFTII